MSSTIALIEADEEVWLPAPIERFAALYQVSNLGRVRSFHPRWKTPKVLVAKIDADGYREVCLCRDKKPYTVPIRRLVALAFHGDERNALHREIAHLDGSRTNDRSDNLRWVSHAENVAHKSLHGTRQAGEKHPRAKLSEAQVARIRTRYAKAATIAADHGISCHAVYDIWQGVRWRAGSRLRKEHP